MFDGALGPGEPNPEERRDQNTNRGFIEALYGIWEKYPIWGLMGSADPLVISNLKSRVAKKLRTIVLLHGELVTFNPKSLHFHDART